MSRSSESVGIRWKLVLGLGAMAWFLVLGIYSVVLWSVPRTVPVMLSQRLSLDTEMLPEPREIRPIIEEILLVMPRDVSPLILATVPEDEILPFPREVVFVVREVIKEVVREVSVPIENPIPEEKKEVCETNKFGTNIAFLNSPPDAFRKALKENKIVFVMHLAGNFEDDAFT